MITKACKKILIIICIMSIILPISSEVLAAITNTTKGTRENFGISLMHTSRTLNNSSNINFGYRISTKNAYRIHAGGDYSKTILCLNKDGKFPGEEGAGGTYTSQGEATAETLKEAKSSIDETGAQKIQWLIKNALLPEDSSELKEQKLSKIFHELMSQTGTTENPLTLNQIKNVLTEDDIVFALQCVLWEITNNTSLNSLQGTTDNGTTWDGLEGNDKWGYKGTKGAYIRQIINYYNTQLNGDLSENNEAKTNPTFNTSAPVTTTILGRYAYIGPFNINASTNYYSIELSFKNSSGNALSNVSYTLTDKASNTDVNVLPQTKEGLEGKNFYVRLPSTTAARSIEFKLKTEVRIEKAEGTVWTNENEENQPLLTIQRSEIPGTTINYGANFDIIIEKQYDASLRKYITAIKRKTAMGGQSIIEVKDRTPVYGLLPSTGEEPFNQYEYRHKKNPLEVQVGDKIVYTIRVTNECEHDMIIKKITDYLPPSGIEYVSEDNLYDNENNKWQYSNNRTAVTTKESGWYLEPNQYAEVKIVCEVTEAAKGRIITNIAEITQIADENNKTVIDIDSEPRNIELPTTEEEWENYRGNEGKTPDKKTEPRYENKDDLTDSNYYYKGQQDDDDFEKITVKISNGEYNLQILKVDKDNNAQALQGARFDITLPDKTTHEVVTDSNGIIQTGKITITETGIDTIKIVETIPPTGYSKLANGIELQVTKDVINGTYGVKQVTLVGTTNGEEMQLNGNTITLKVKNEKLTGQYDLQIVKTDKDDNTKKLAGAKFEVTLPNGSKKELTTATDGTIKTEKINIIGTGKDTITVKELQAPEDYNKIIDSLEIEATKEIKNGYYALKEVSIKNNPVGAEATLDGNTIILNIKNEKIKDAYDLALKKFITNVETADGTKKQLPEDQKRFIKVTNVDDLIKRKGQEIADAKYSLNKTPVKIVDKDYVTYTIRVFNEGKTDAIVKEIRDTLPKGLEFVPYETNADGSYKSGSKTNYTYKWKTSENNEIRTNYTNNTKLPGFDTTKQSGENKELGISYVDIKVECKVNISKLNDSEQQEIYKNGIKNIAEITDDNGDDNDSTPDNKKPEEDDEDYDIIILQVYDLALKKFITTLTTTDGTNKIIPEAQKRFIEVTNVDSLVNRTGNEKADATYKLNKTPVNVADGDYITYTIRVFNEGEVDSIVKELVDTVPEGLEFVPYEKNADGSYKSGSKTNYTYQWETFEKNEETAGWTKGIKTNYLEKTVIPKFDKTKASGENKELGLSYIDVKVEFKVNISKLEDKTKEEILKNGIKNIAEITEDDGDDNDSTPDNKKPEEDDEDYDIVIPLQFDLALRKFITKIENTDVIDRIPKVTYKDGKLKYEHTKEPKMVVQNQVVTYTIRVYNEGTQNGYATEITDDLPEGITFLPEHETNKKYEWKMYDENGKETTDVSKAKKIKTNYLSREKSKDNLLTAFDKSKDISETNPSYKEVKAAFKVTQDSVTAGNKVITNTAEITEDEDENGNPVDDIDSVPDNNEENEDDIDKEHLILKYFDLSLLKYVSKVIVTEDGLTKEIETGYDGTENPEPVVKVELNKKKLDKTSVKYVYSIKITNEGEIEGYATEITDRIPNGLAFYEEDNTKYKWKAKEKGIVTTDYLKDTLLKPGESAVVPIVLRWERDESNLGQKVNVAEISKDENEFGAPDIDSTPNNNKEGEDDQDNAIVVLTLKTGSAPIYITLIITTMVIISSGVYLIYKHVIR